MAQVAANKYDVWTYNGYTVEVFAYREQLDMQERTFILDIGLPLPVDYGIIIYKGTYGSPQPYLNVFNMHFEDWNERHSIAAYWIDTWAKPVSKFKQVLLNINPKNRYLMWRARAARKRNLASKSAESARGIFSA